MQSHLGIIINNSILFPGRNSKATELLLTETELAQMEFCLHQRNDHYISLSFLGDNRNGNHLIMSTFLSSDQERFFIWQQVPKPMDLLDIF